MSALAERLTQRAAELRAQADDLTDAAAQIVDPPPVDPPPIDPPPVLPPPAVGELRAEQMNRERMVFFAGWHEGGSAYMRSQSHTVLTPGVCTFQIGRMSFRSAVATDTAPRTWGLLIDGLPRGQISMADGITTATLAIDVSDLAAGWHRLQLDGLANGETCPTWFACMVREGEAPPDTMPVATGSYDFHWDNPRNEHAWTMAPAKYEPRAVPLPEHGPYEPFAEAAKAVRVDMLVPGEGGNVFLPNVDANGVVSAFNRQAYYWDDFIRKIPRVTLLDGPRGIGTIVFPSHIEIGRAAPMSTGPINNTYGCDPWRLWKVRDNGTVITLAGYRHRGMGSYWRDEPGATLELVGDWSAIPEERRGFHTLWGMCWDQTSLVTNEAADPIPTERNLKPHLGAGPAALLADSQNNRICKVQFSPVQHGAPAKVTEFAVGLKDPWDIVEDAARDRYYVSERAANRIIALDRAGNYLETLIQADPANVVECYLRTGVHQMGLRGGPADTRKATAKLHPCIGPEGLYLLDDWLYFGSVSLGEVRRLNLVTRELQFVIAPVLDGNSRFIKFAVSDGSFGPKETVFAQTWSIFSVHQSVYLLDGTQWKLQQSVPWGGTGYGSAVGVRDGRMVTGTSNYGLRRYSAGTPFDRAKFERGEAEFEALHGRILYGTQGFGHYGQALPWGRSADLDYYLATNGHQPPA